jgi:hypothetical protein
MPRGFQIAILLACVTILTLAFLLDADETGVYVFGWKWPLQCPMYATLGVKCASCGLTRALCYAAHGNFSQASAMNAMWPAVFGAILLEIPYRLMALAIWPGKISRPLVMGHGVVITGVIVLLMGYWLIYLGGLLR